MKKLKKFMFSPKGTLVAFGAAMVLLLLSTIGGARAAVTIISENRETQIEMQHIGVSLQEKNGESWNTVATSAGSWEKTGDNVYDQSGQGSLALPAIAAEGTDEQGKAKGVKVGKTYSENLRVVNSGEIDQYVRVTIYKYWEKEAEKNGGKQWEKQKDLYPSRIKLDYADDWTVDTSATTQERTVLYYTGIPLGSGASVPVVDGITIDPAVSTIMNTDGTYPYQGCRFKVEVQVDAVQTHNAEDAILSAWGKTVTVNNDGSLSGIN